MNHNDFDLIQLTLDRADHLEQQDRLVQGVRVTSDRTIFTTPDCSDSCIVLHHDLEQWSQAEVVLLEAKKNTEGRGCPTVLGLPTNRVSDFKRCIDENMVLVRYNQYLIISHQESRSVG